MFAFLTHQKGKFLFSAVSRLLTFVLSFSLVFGPSAAQAQTIASLNLPVPGAMVGPSQAFVPVLLKGMTIHPDNPLQFDFIIDSGNTNFTQDQIKDESQRLVKYFLASMTIPKDDLWVNLSPYEKDRIIPDELGKTELGRDMLAQDYILKQLTASLMYPEKELGKTFWDKVYRQAKEKYGTTEIPVDTFNKVWILPETATVYEHGQTVYIVEARLKVMLDADYLASDQSSVVSGQKKDLNTEHWSLSTKIIKEIILPEIEKEVNQGQNFAPLRQIYHSLILAKWYKETIKNSLLSKIYIDQKKIAGVNLDDTTLKDQIYAQYMEAYKKGVFNYIKEDYDQLSHTPIPRKYFSGGIDRLMNFKTITLNRVTNPNVVESGRVGKNFNLALGITPQKQGASSPIAFPGTTEWHISRLNHSNSEVRLKAVQKLAKRGDTRAVEPLIARLGDSDYDVRRVAAEALGRLGATKEQMVDGYLKALGSSDSSVRRAAAEALGKLGDQRAVEPLIARLDDSDYDVRRVAAEALGRLGATKEQMVDGYLKALGSSDSSVRRAAAEALGKLGDQRAVEPLIARLDDSDYDVRRVVTPALGQLGDIRAVEPLTARLGDSDSYVRDAAIKALGKLKDKQAVISFLFERLGNSSFVVSYDATVKALGKLSATREQMIYFYLAVIQKDYFLGDVAGEALEKLGVSEKETVDVYLKAMESSNSYVRRTAIHALGNFEDTRKDTRMIIPLLRRLEDSNSDVRNAVTETLSKLGATKELIDALRLMSKEQFDIWTNTQLQKNNEKLNQLVNEISKEPPTVKVWVPASTGGAGRGRIDLVTWDVEEGWYDEPNPKLGILEGKVKTIKKEIEIINSIKRISQETISQSSPSATPQSSSPMTDQERARFQTSMAKQYTAVLLDVDFTLTDQDRNVPSEVVGRIAELLRSGVPVGLVSARAHQLTPADRARTKARDLAEIVEQIRSALGENSLSSINNLYLFPENGSYGFSAGTPDAVINFRISSVSKDEGFLKTLMNSLTDLTENNIVRKRHAVTWRLENLAETQIAEIQRQIDEKIRELEKPYSVTKTKDSIEIVPTGAGKDAALREFATQLTIDLANVATAGDQGLENGNDFPMLNRAGGFSVETSADDSVQVNLPKTIEKRGWKAALWLLHNLQFQKRVETDTNYVNIVVPTVVTNLIKNVQPGYGLTIVSGAPFNSPELIARIDGLQAALRGILGNDGVVFNTSGNHSALHSTIFSLSRTKNFTAGNVSEQYKTLNEALPTGKLTPKLAANLTNTISNAKPYKIRIKQVLIDNRPGTDKNGSLLANGELTLLGEVENKTEFQVLIGGLKQSIDQSGLDIKTDTPRISISLGRLAVAPDSQAFQQLLNTINVFNEDLVTHPIIIDVSELKLVLYAHRSLNNVAHEMILNIGQKNPPISFDDFKIVAALRNLIGLTGSQLNEVLPGHRDHKYDPDTFQALPFEGISVIHNIDRGEAERMELSTMAQEFRQMLVNDGLGRMFAFVDLNSFHATTFDLINEPETRAAFADQTRNTSGLTYAEVRRDVENKTREFMQNGDGQGYEAPHLSTQVKITGIGMFPPGIVKLNLEITDPKKKQEFDTFREKLHAYLTNNVPGYSLVRERLGSLAGHITIGYTMNPISREEIETYVNILKTMNARFQGNGVFANIGFELTQGELTGFSDMNTYFPLRGSPVKQALKDYQYEVIETLDPEIFAAIVKLEENIETDRRMPEQAFRRFLDIPGRIALLARDQGTGEVIGYIFGLPQQAVPETRGGSTTQLSETFYEMSWQVLPQYQGKGIGSALRYQLRDAARRAGYKYIALHQNDTFDENAIKEELSFEYAQGDELFALQKDLPPHGRNMEQQYVVIKLAQASSSPVQSYKIPQERRNELADLVHSLAQRSPQVLRTEKETLEPTEHTVLAFVAKYHLADGEKELQLTLIDYPQQGRNYADEGKTRVNLSAIEWDGQKSVLAMVIPGNAVLSSRVLGDNPIAILYEVTKHIKDIDINVHVYPITSSPLTDNEQSPSGKIQAAKDNLGGIDMNSIDLDKQGAGVDIQFDPAELQEIIDAGIDGFAPVIINITPLPSVLPLLGLEPQRKEDELEVSSLN